MTAPVTSKVLATFALTEEPEAGPTEWMTGHLALRVWTPPSEAVALTDVERGVLGRWEAYARDGHGGNVALRDALDIDPTQPERYTFSLLRVFGSNTPQPQIDAAEKHYKEALMTRRFGLNRN